MWHQLWNQEIGSFPSIIAQKFNLFLNATFFVSSTLFDTAAIIIVIYSNHS